MGLHGDIAAGLADLRGFAGFPGVYARGALSCAVTASLGNTPLERVIDEDTGTVLKTIAADWMIAVAELVLDGLPATPQRGDLLTIDGTVYEVQPLGSEPCFAYSDALGTQYRIHVKQRAA